MLNERLFAKRVPEAAARQCGVVLAWATECHLATLEMLQERKSASKRDLHRQQEICARAVEQCHDLGIEPVGLRGYVCTRLQERLKQLAGSSGEGGSL